MTSLPKVRTHIGKPANNSNLAQLRLKNRQDNSQDSADSLASTAVADNIVKTDWTSDMVDMTPVPYEGSSETDPHSEILAHDSTGTQLLDIRDKPKKANQTPLVIQQADLFAQIETSQQTEITHSCSAAHDRIKGDRVDFFAQNTLFTD